MRKFCAAILSVALISTSAFAASSLDNGLAPGKPAGVRQAQTGNQVVMVIAGVAIAAMVVALSSGGSGSGGGGVNQGGSPPSTGTL
jgi:hypothetical protein